MSHKKLLVLTFGAGDILLSDNSKGKLKTAKVFRGNLERMMLFFSNPTEAHGVLDIRYSSDRKLDVDVFRVLDKKRLIEFKLVDRNLLSAENIMSIRGHGSQPEKVKASQFDFLFPPEEYELGIAGIDLHGIFKTSIEELLGKGYTVKVFSDACSILPDTRDLINSLRQDKDVKGKFHFCSYN